MCEWLTIFKNGCTSVTIEERSGQPFTSCTDESIQLVYALILNNLQAIIDEMAKQLPIMHGSANTLPNTLFIHSVFCLTTGPKPPKRCLRIVRSRASSFK